MNKSLVITKTYPISEFPSCIITEENICIANHNILVKGLWDTGSSDSVISSDFVKKHNLQPIGTATVGTIGATSKSNIYSIDFLLAQKQHISLNVTKSSQLCGSGFDMLIGLDVITLGDFALTTTDDIICFSFRYPSKGLIDFTKE